MAIYFHRTQRCPTCLKMGSYSEEAVITKYAEQIKAGKISFHYVDFQDPKNAQIAKAYGINGPALIVAKAANKKVAGYKNLKEIWKKVADKEEFIKYVQNNIDTYNANAKIAPSRTRKPKPPKKPAKAQAKPGKGQPKAVADR